MYTIYHFSTCENNNKLEIYTFDEIKDEFIGKKNTSIRKKYEQDLKFEIFNIKNKKYFDRNSNQV